MDVRINKFSNINQEKGEIMLSKLKIFVLVVVMIAVPAAMQRGLTMSMQSTILTVHTIGSASILLPRGGGGCG